MTTIYCPLKRCQYNAAKTAIDEGICTKDEIEMGDRFWNSLRFIFCPEYDEEN